MAKSAPKSPDYAAAAEKQGESSREVTEAQTWANRPNQYTPFGSQEWQNTPEFDPTTGKSYNQWSQYTTLNPESQRAVDAQLGLTADRSELGSSLMPRAQQEYGSAMNWDQFENMGGRVNAGRYTPGAVQDRLSPTGLQGVDPSQRYAQNAEDAIYGKFQSRMQPRFERDDDRQRARLYAQGLREGDAAFDSAIKDQGQEQDDAYEQAAYQATIGGGAEAQRFHAMDTATRTQQFGERGAMGDFYNQAQDQRFGQQLAAGQAQFGENQAASAFQTQRRQQQMAEEMQRRGFSLNEINAILTGQQVGLPSMPGFQSASKAEGVQYNQAAQSQGQADLDRYNAQQQAMQGMMSGVGDMAGGFMPGG